MIWVSGWRGRGHRLGGADEQYANLMNTFIIVNIINSLLTFIILLRLKQFMRTRFHTITVIFSPAHFLWSWKPFNNHSYTPSYSWCTFTDALKHRVYVLFHVTTCYNISLFEQIWNMRGKIMFRVFTEKKKFPFDKSSNILNLWIEIKTLGEMWHFCAVLM